MNALAWAATHSGELAVAVVAVLLMGAAIGLCVGRPASAQPVHRFAEIDALARQATPPRVAVHDIADLPTIDEMGIGG